MFKLEMDLNWHWASYIFSTFISGIFLWDVGCFSLVAYLWKGLVKYILFLAGTSAQLK
jgi:hypothetical protein